MSKPYDVTTKDLIETDPAGWLEFLGRPVPPEWVTLVDADVSTVSAAADKVIKVNEPSPWLLHIELQASRDDALPLRLLRYQSLLRYRHGLPVTSVAVLLRPAADAPHLTGRLDGRTPLGPEWFFGYDVVRVWQRPASAYVSGPLGLVPYAPLAATPEELPRVVAGIGERFDSLDRPTEARLWTASYILSGLRHDRDVMDAAFKGVLEMEESVTYQAILTRGTQQGLNQGLQQGLNQGRGLGKLEEARTTLLRLGRKRFGSIPAELENRLDAIVDLAQLHHLQDKTDVASSWDDVFRDA